MFTTQQLSTVFTTQHCQLTGSISLLTGLVPKFRIKLGHHALLDVHWYPKLKSNFQLNTQVTTKFVSRLWYQSISTTTVKTDRVPLRLTTSLVPKLEIKIPTKTNRVTHEACNWPLVSKLEIKLSTEDTGLCEACQLALVPEE